MVGCLPIIELRSEVAQSWGWAELFRLRSVGEDSAYFLDQGISICLSVLSGVHVVDGYREANLCEVEKPHSLPKLQRHQMKRLVLYPPLPILSFFNHFICFTGC